MSDLSARPAERSGAWVHTPPYRANRWTVDIDATPPDEPGRGRRLVYAVSNGQSHHRRANVPTRTGSDSVCAAAYSHLGVRRRTRPLHV